MTPVFITRVFITWAFITWAFIAWAFIARVFVRHPDAHPALPLIFVPALVRSAAELLAPLYVSALSEIPLFTS